jgi:hypothetical protein
VGIVVAALGAHRQKAGDFVLAPRAVADARALAGFIGAGLEPSAIDAHDRKPGGHGRLGRRAVVLELINQLLPGALQLRTDFMSDSPHLSATDGDLGQIGQRFRGIIEGTAPGGCANDLTKDRR